MFTQARLKLTAWYLAVIILVSAMFSAAIYRSIVFELDRLTERQRIRWERGITALPQPYIEPELLIEAKHRVQLNLLMTNLMIWAGAGVLGYYLAGKTLKPIETMMQQQYRFVSDASHELKTPLTAMRTTLEVTLRGSLGGEEAEKVLRDNLTEVERLQKLTEGLLELSRDGRPLPISSTRVQRVLSAAVNNVMPLAAKKQITISALPKNQLSAQVHEESLIRALVAILDNAIKYSPAKSVIKIQTKKQGRQVWIVISDQGKGIPAAEIGQVTERFYRGEKARSSPGYGLGLAIAQKIITAHKGNLGIESRLGKGTKVTIALPYSARIQGERV